MKPMVGVSAFGLKDCVAQVGTGCRELGFYLTSAVLPTNPFGRILTGEEAYKDRTHIGLSWPPEARIKVGEPVRRCPISVVWRALIEAEDRLARWNAGRGVSFSLARILAKHVEGLVTINPLAETFTAETTKSESSALTVAIPNHLDEFGQDLLLRELSVLGFGQTILVWRPVAAALSWLDKIEGDFLKIKKDMKENDHIHVLYLGPDALEFTTFRLKVKEHNDRDYVLPLRDRPKDILPITGADWAGRLIEERFTEIDEGAFWQAFIQFPEIWQALAEKPWKPTDLPRPWSLKGKWKFWNPEPDLSSYIYNTNVTDCITLRQVLKKSCQLESHSGPTSSSIGEFFRNEVKRMAHLYPEGRLRGMIFCGPLAPKTVPPWLSSELELLTSRGLKVEGNLDEPEAGHLWLSANCDDPIAEGAAIYGRKISLGIPSYLDTMPQLSILASERGHYTWVPLLNAQEVWGGEEHIDTISRRFHLDAGKRNLHVYLYRGPVDDARIASSNIFDPLETPLNGVSPCQARLIREVVRRLGNLEAVQKQVIFQGKSREALYGRAFAEALFMSREQDTNPLEPSHLEIFRGPLRRAVFDFPSAPERDTVLDIEVRIRPASGLAKIKILPNDTSFLQGDIVRFNYSAMKFASKLPRRMRGWPRIEEIVVDPEDEVLFNGKDVVEVFEKTHLKDQKYTQVIDKIPGLIDRTIRKQPIPGLFLYLKAIDQYGRACGDAGNEILHRIASKFNSDFRQINLAQESKLLDRIFTRAAWLYASTPSNIVAYVRNTLTSWISPQRWNWAVEAASRAFVKAEDFQLLFQAIARRVRSDPSNVKTFPINAARATCNVLMLRKEGEKGLDRDMAQLFAKCALQRLLNEQEKLNFRTTYFQVIRLLLYLLRYRKTDPSCFDPNVPQRVAVFEKAKKSMEIAKSSFPAHSPKRKQIQKIIEGFDKFLHYEGTEEGIPELRDLAENDT
ncbi:MAG: hypothetical protein DRG33_00715 [Deltaproteobacteria bacterium]|nr:MAG: hypothetical protein DRG33_00715 [Deltaproteobacteria bacterium]